MKKEKGDVSCLPAKLRRKKESGHWRQQYNPLCLEEEEDSFCYERGVVNLEDET